MTLTSPQHKTEPAGALLVVLSLSTWHHAEVGVGFFFFIFF